MKKVNTKKLKKENGVTLVALVVTIVVLLILAGVSISMVLGNNGLISRAKDAKTQTEQDAVNTETAMNNLYDEMMGILGENGESTGGNGGSDENPVVVEDPYEGQTAQATFEIGKENPSDVIAYLYLNENENYDLVVRGTGETMPFGHYVGCGVTREDNPFAAYTIEKAYITDGVISISDAMFCDFTSLIEVNMSDSIIKIGDGAFQHCKKLKSVVIPKNVTSIGNGAFYDCETLESIVLPNGLVNIGNDSFYNCLALIKMEIPSSVTSIGDLAFSGCFGLTDIYYSGTEDDWKVITIGKSNTNLRSATIHYNSTGPESN